MNKKIQLFIFPYAGGSAFSLKPLADLIDEEVEVVLIEYPGRGGRADEPLPGSLQEMIKDSGEYCRMRRERDVPFALMGYSMGSIIAYELMSQGCIEGDLKHFFGAAEISPRDRSKELQSLGIPTDEMIVDRMVDLGGLDPELVKDPRFREIYLGPAITDYKHIFSYKYSGDKKPANVNATFFYCENDTAVDKVKKWEELINGKVDYHEFGQNHFFINMYYAKMAEIINEHLREYM